MTLQSDHEEGVQPVLPLCQPLLPSCCLRSHWCRRKSQKYWRRQSCPFSGQLTVGRTGELAETVPSSYLLSLPSGKCQKNGWVSDTWVLWFFKLSTCRAAVSLLGSYFARSSLQPIKSEKEICVGPNTCPFVATVSGAYIYITPGGPHIGMLETGEGGSG